MSEHEQEQLAEYRRKRDFDRTAEPAGRDKALGGGAASRLSFVVQKHAASSLHYDFRLELDGVLKSWAVPKGPSLDVIPEAEYGGGTVLVWDTGWWEIDLAWIDAVKEPHLAEPTSALAKGELKFVLHGSKLTGSWALVQMKGRGEKNWLLIKHRDEAARPGHSLVDDSPDSAVTGRSLEQVQRDNLQ
jgi:bifunctional non-homologous end joining protein LigD